MKNTDQCAVTDIKRVTRIAAVFFVIAATTYKRFRNNLTQELAGADEDFRKHLDRIADDWRTGIRAAFERGQEAGNVRKDVNTAAVASLVFATYQGLIGSVKTSHDMDAVLAALSMFLDLLEGLRP